MVKSLKRAVFKSWESLDLRESIKHIYSLISDCPEISLSTALHCQSLNVKYCHGVLGGYSFNVSHMSQKRKCLILSV